MYGVHGSLNDGPVFSLAQCGTHSSRVQKNTEARGIRRFDMEQPAYR